MANMYSVVMNDFTNDDPTGMVVKAALQTTVLTTSLPEEATMAAERTCQELVERLEETEGVEARWEFVIDGYLVWMTKAGAPEEIAAFRIEIEEMDDDEVEIVDTDLAIDDILLARWPRSRARVFPRPSGHIRWCLPSQSLSLTATQRMVVRLAPTGRLRFSPNCPTSTEPDETYSGNSRGATLQVPGARRGPWTSGPPGNVGVPRTTGPCPGP